MPRDLHRRQRAVLQHGQMREQVELLEHHADFAAHRVEALRCRSELDAVDDDPALLVVSSWLMQRISVDLPEPDGPHSTIFSPGGPTG